MTGKLTNKEEGGRQTDMCIIMKTVSETERPTDIKDDKRAEKELERQTMVGGQTDICEDRQRTQR